MAPAVSQHYRQHRMTRQEGAALELQQAAPVGACALRRDAELRVALVVSPADQSRF